MRFIAQSDTLTQIDYATHSSSALESSATFCNFHCQANTALHILAQRHWRDTQFLVSIHNNLPYTARVYDK